MPETTSNPSTRENLEYYKKLQQSRGDHSYEYKEKQYPRGFTMPDKKVVDSRYSPSLPRLTQKHVLLFISYIIILLIFSHIYRQNRAFTTFIGFITVLYLLSIPVFYLVKKQYYFFLIYLISIIIFGTMGYGWGLIGILISLNPLKPKKPLIKNNVVKTNSKPIK
jgi:hypothetical protein